ncbi:sensor histidine kinase [Archangium primigenium]|uniref:sensor histidine kinase n=1 Tax=[Archangium] primigenium TaxID=2792470 RepID=UPI00195B9272|nr:HWE histidine kinase domain-containing protein [Archangium primigenium]MBM7115099.1 PAS domain-containing protein [Archangium primigenium]
MSWPLGPSEMARRIREHDWTATPLGPSTHWPGALRTLVDMLLANGFPMIALWGPDLIQLYNDGYRDIMGLKHPAGLGQATQVCWPEVWHINAPIYARVLQGESLSFEDALYPLMRNGLLENVWLSLSYSPLRDETGTIAGVLVTLVETTESLRAAAELRESEARFRALVMSTSDSLYRMSPDWREMREMRGKGILSDTHAPSPLWEDTYLLPEDRPWVMARIDEAIRNRTPFELEHRVRHADGSVGWTLSRAFPLLDEKGEVVEWFGLAADITARKEAERERERAEALVQVDRVRRVLVAEIQHRSRNLLAVVRSLVVQSLRAARSLGEAETRITDRLAALSRVHGLLSRAELPAVTVRELVELELGATAHGVSDRLVLDGPDVTLPGRAVRTFSLALHELATNAVKHGALGADRRGRVLVTWGLRDSATLFLEWVETGAVAPSPRRDAARGFGRELIEQALPYELDARTRLDIREDGVRCTIELPLGEAGP